MELIGDRFRNPYDQLLISVKKGGSLTGNMLSSKVEVEQRPNTFLEPGDTVVFNNSKNSILKQYRVPVSYDLWYLTYAVNILSRTTDKYDYIPERQGQANIPNTYITNQFDFLLNQLKGVMPLLFVRDIKALFTTRILDYNNSIPANWLNAQEYFVNLLAYEMWNTFISAKYDSVAPDRKYGFKRDDAVGYFSFPAGQLGVMEVISIIKETQLEDPNFNLPAEEEPILTSNCDFFFPPKDDIYVGYNKCYGEHIIRSGYVVPDNNGTFDQPNKRLNVEYHTVVPFSSAVYNDPRYHIRYWIHRDEKFPTPGEFIGILVRPLASPPHAWWFQRSSPFLYAGNWIETTFLTLVLLQIKSLKLIELMAVLVLSIRLRCMVGRYSVMLLMLKNIR